MRALACVRVTPPRKQPAQQQQTRYKAHGGMLAPSDAPPTSEQNRESIRRNEAQQAA